MRVAKPRIYKRWISISRPKIRFATRQGSARIAFTLAEMNGAIVESAWKSDMCRWYSFRSLATKKQMSAIDAAWKHTGLDTYNRIPAGAWPA